MFRRYKPFFRTGAMNLLAYKFQMIMWLVISALQVACIFFLWDGVYKSSTTEVINGYTFEQMIVYMAFVNVATFVVLAVTQCGQSSGKSKTVPLQCPL